MIFIGGISQGQKILDYVKLSYVTGAADTGDTRFYAAYMYFSFSLFPCSSGIRDFM